MPIHSTQASFDAYCLEQAAPGASHTGVYLFSFDFVYVGNHHIRNLLMMSALLSILQSILLFVTGCIMLNALRLEKETGFTSWLMVMGVFVMWRVLAWAYGSIVNDMIFGYHIFTLIIWMALSTLSALSWAVVYSLYLQLTSITKIETSARMKMDTMGSSRFQNLTFLKHDKTAGHIPCTDLVQQHHIWGEPSPTCLEVESTMLTLWRATPAPACREGSHLDQTARAPQGCFNQAMAEIFIKVIRSSLRSEDYAPPLPLSPPPPLEPLYASIPR